MTRLFARFFLTCTILALAAGPVVAAPVAIDRDHSIGTPTVHPASPFGLLELLLTAPLVFGAIRVKDIGTIAKKFKDRASAAAPEFATNAEAAAGDWENNTAASEDNWAAGTQEAISQKRFSKGVRGAGSGRYAARVKALGADRFRTGINAAEADFAKGMGPVLQTIASITLPPRRPKGDPANMERANVVARTLRRMKTGA